MHYAPSEAAIEKAIEARIGSAGFFQRVAEQVTKGIYPHLANDIVPSGRRADDKTIRGWPDAYVLTGEGSIVAIEATTSRDAARRHWSADLEKLQANIPLARRAGLVWVAWCDPQSPTSAADMQGQAAALGVSPQDVHIIFRRDLCNRLRAPCHAKFWTNDLGLRVTSAPFSSIEDVIDRNNMQREKGIFPTATDYRAGHVYAPPVIAKIETSLVREGAALVVGHGAAGKTTLAMTLAHRPRFRRRPNYYLDLSMASSDSELGERACDAMAAIADQGVLFILDNAHLMPAVAAQIVQQWHGFSSGSALLVLTRRIRAGTDIWNEQPEPEAFPLPTFELIIGPSDLEGVYRRHYRAHNSVDPAPVAPEILAHWSETFGGDLLVFSAAVLALLNRGGESSDLALEDARVFVRRRYLGALGLASEKAALLDLAAIAQVEGFTPVDAFPYSALEESCRRGLVWIEQRRLGDPDKFYRLSHPGLGTLLRDAAGCTNASREVRARVLKNHPFSSVLTAVGLRQRGEIEEANALIATLWMERAWPLEFLPLRWWKRLIKQAKLLNLATNDDIIARAETWYRDGENRQRLFKQVSETPVLNLFSFLNRAGNAVSKVGAIIVAELAKNPGLVSAQARIAPLDHVASFLNRAEKLLPSVVLMVRAELVKNPGTLAGRANAIRLGHLAPFLRYADATMPDVAQRLRRDLLSEEHLPGLAKRAVQDGPSQLVSLCKNDTAFTEMIPAIDVDEWSRRWGYVSRGTPHWFIRFAQICYQANREVLVRPVAEAIIRKTRAADFCAPGMTIRHLAFIVTSSHTCSAAEVDAFFSRCALADWISDQYRSPETTIGALANAARAIALDEREWLRPKFALAALGQRVRNDEPSSSAVPRHAGEWLQLLSASLLLGVPITGVRSIDTPWLGDVLTTFAPDADSLAVQPMQAGLWAGLREWSRFSGIQLAVEAELAEPLLAQFRAANLSDRPRMAAFNETMIRWLERCQGAGWRLVAEERPLAIELAHLLGNSHASPEPTRIICR